MKLYLLKALSLIVVAMGLLAVTGCATAPRSEQGRENLRNEALDVIAEAQHDDPTLAKVMNEAVAYAVFPTVGKGGLGIAGAYGHGALFQGGKVIGYCDITQASIGFVAGGQAYSEILCFKDVEALASFMDGRFAFDAQATAVAIQSGAGSNAKFAHGVAVFTRGEKGLMFEASIGGQKFSYVDR